jgi:hypothetical protein
MKTLKEIQKYYNEHRYQYDEDLRKQIKELLRYCEQGNGGDCADQHYLEQIVFQPVGPIEMFTNIDDWRPNKNKWFRQQLAKDRPSSNL